MISLKDKVCIITGAGSGIGAYSAEKFAEAGAIVYAVDITTEGLSKLNSKINTRQVDVSNSTQVNQLAEEIFASEGRIDVLINNAGITRDATLLKMTDDQFDQVIAVNLKGVFLTGRAVAGYMARNGSGSIINTTSIVGVQGNIGQTNYSASKAGVIGMTKTWAKELGRKGIRVNAVAPGFTKTEMLSTVPEKILDSITEKTPLKRLGTTEDIAALYAFLASNSSSFITGQTIGIDGGLTL